MGSERYSRSSLVQSDLTAVCRLSVDSKLVPASHYSDLVKPGVAGVKQLSQLFNLTARLKSWHTQRSSRPLSLYVGVMTLLFSLRDAKEHLLRRYSP